MKQKISILLALLLVLFAGCAQQPEMTQPQTQPQTVPETTEATEPLKPEPPRTPEEFLSRLNDTLKQQDIPVEFVFAFDSDSYYGVYASWYRPVYIGTDTLASQNMQVILVPESTKGYMVIQFIIGNLAAEEDWELHQKICTAAATLCDPQMTQEQVAALFAAEPSETEYVSYTGKIGSFTKREFAFLPPDDGTEGTYHIDGTEYSAVFCQPDDLVHAVMRYPAGNYECYQIDFTEAEEEPFAERYFSAPSVAELEQRINDALAQKGLPVTCLLAPYQSYGRWKGVLRYTVLDDPDYTYPEFPYEYFSGGQEDVSGEPEDVSGEPEEVSREIMEQFLRNALGEVRLYIETVDPVRKEAPVTRITLSDFDRLPELAEVLCTACGTQEDLSALQALEPEESAVRSQTWERVLPKDTYSITQWTDQEDSGDVEYVIEYEAYVPWEISVPGPELLLDPAVLDYPFAWKEPMVADGLFNIYLSGGPTLFHGELSWLQDLINDYLVYTRSNLSVDYYFDNKGEHFAVCYWDEPLNTNVYRIDQHEVAVEVYYNGNVRDHIPNWEFGPMEKEHMMYLPIGISLMLDEALTVEEAVRLHSHAGEYDFVSTEEDKQILPVGYQVTVYGTGEVVHIAAENPETGANYYCAVTRDYVENSDDHSRLLPYLED